MINIFETRTFSEQDRTAIKMAVDDTIETLNQLKVLNEHMNDNTKAICERLNDGQTDPDMKIKPSLIKKLAKAKIKEDVEAQKKGVEEIETGLDWVYKLS